MFSDPVELFLFETASHQWRFTSAEEPVDYDGFTYETANVKASGITSTSELTKSNLQLAVPRDFAIAQLFHPYPPAEVIALTKYKVSRQNPASSPQVDWIGRVLNCRWEGVKALLDAESAATSKKRTGLTRSYGAECPHVLYGADCGVNKQDYLLADTAAAVSGNILQVAGASSEADGYYDGGFVYWYNGVFGDYRFIESHTGSNLTLMFPTYGLSVGQAVFVYPGCARTLSVCNSKFANALNYGGWPFNPDVIPFNGTNVF